MACSHLLCWVPSLLEAFPKHPSERISTFLLNFSRGHGTRRRFSSQNTFTAIKLPECIRTILHAHWRSRLCVTGSQVLSRIINEARNKRKVESDHLERENRNIPYWRRATENYRAAKGLRVVRIIFHSFTRAAHPDPKIWDLWVARKASRYTMRAEGGKI